MEPILTTVTRPNQDLVDAFFIPIIEPIHMRKQAARGNGPCAGSLLIYGMSFFSMCGRQVRGLRRKDSRAAFLLLFFPILELLFRTLYLLWSTVRI